MTTRISLPPASNTIVFDARWLHLFSTATSHLDICRALLPLPRASILRIIPEAKLGVLPQLCRLLELEGHIIAG
jgi:hypothetical protein